MTIRFCISNGKTLKKTVVRVNTKRRNCKPRYLSKTQEKNGFFEIISKLTPENF